MHGIIVLRAISSIPHPETLPPALPNMDSPHWYNITTQPGQLLPHAYVHTCNTTMQTGSTASPRCSHQQTGRCHTSLCMSPYNQTNMYIHVQPLHACNIASLCAGYLGTLVRHWPLASLSPDTHTSTYHMHACDFLCSSTSNRGF